MLFNSFNFVFIFFPLVTVIYFLLPHRFRWFWLLLASCYFYMAFVPKYILILAVTIVVDYFAGIYIEKSTGRKRKVFLILSIVANVGVLAFYKYFNFLADNISGLVHLLHWNYSVPLLNIILPIGLSFHTFQAMSYTIEVYRGKQKAERHFGIYALYVMFYPQLVAGPIERPQNLLPQFHEEKFANESDIVKGLQRMLFGLFKKVFIADRLAILVNVVFGHVGDFQGFTLIFATIFFAFQLYCDFSGYSDIAVGSAKVLGFNLMENFERPYFSKSIAEFWRRWHISLMNWLRDYLYFPLLFSGRHRGKWWVFFSLLVTFFISGLWHGADWKYVCMGVLNGFYIVFSQQTVAVRQWLVNFCKLNKIPVFYRLLQMVSTYFLICLGWIFFRAENVSSALVIFSRLTGGWGALFNKSGLKVLELDFFHGSVLDSTQKVQIVGLFVSIVLLVASDLFERNKFVWQYLQNRSLWIRWGFYYLILIFGKIGTQQFIYFQF